MKCHYITEYPNSNQCFAATMRPAVSANERRVLIVVELDTRNRLELEYTLPDLAGLGAMITQVQQNDLGTDDDDIIAQMHRQLTEG